MDKKDLQDMIEQSALNKNVPVSEMPSLDLYAEQVVAFAENALGTIKRTEDDKLLTRTMINNYTRDGILISPSNKKYSKEHLILLSVIIRLKNILSIKDIKALLKPILNKTGEEADNTFSLEDIYTTFLDIKETTFNDIVSVLDNKLELIKKNISITDKTDKTTVEWLILVLLFISEADDLKRLSEKIIDTHFRKLET